MILLSLTFQDMIKASLIFDLVWRRNDYNQLVKPGASCTRIISKIVYSLSTSPYELCLVN